MRFAVWAPNARSVAVVLRNERHVTERIEMKDAGRGNFEIEVRSASAGMRYGYSLDGGDILPDPRSPFQPDGVHGMSCVVDHAAFWWSDDEWHGIDMRDAIIYELHIGTFSLQGTFVSAIDHLDRLCDIGVTAVEIMPIAEFPGSHGWGYDGVDLYAPHHAFGGPDGFKQLVEACHARGLAVLLDVVYNHLGPDGNYLSQYAPYFTDHYKTPWGNAVNFDVAHSDGVRAFVVDNALMWLRDYHVDGLRLDAVHAIIDTSATHLVEQLSAEVRKLERETGKVRIVIAENNRNDPRLVRSSDTGGYGLDGIWNDDFHHAIHTRVTGETQGYYVDFAARDCIVKCLNDGFVYDGRYSEFRQRHFGRELGDIPRWRLIAFTQNHDQVGNRAFGDRPSSVAGRDRMKIAAALVLLSPFTPLFFQGEEWGAKTPFLYFTDHEDSELGRAVAEGRKAEFAVFSWDGNSVPDPQSPDTFANSKLNWNEREQSDGVEMLEWYRALIDLRRSVRDSPTKAWDDGDVINMSRGTLRLSANLGTSPWEEDLVDGWDVTLAAGETAAIADGKLRLAPDSVVIATRG